MTATDGGAASAGMPVLLSGARLRALVVGGGAVAARKLAALLDGGAGHVRVIAPELSSEVRAAAARATPQRVELLEREYASDDLRDANLVVAATNVRAVNARVARDADAVGRLVSVVDAPAEGSWTSMATHRSGPMVIAVSAGGVPGAAARVRDALAARFDARYGDAAGRLAALRTALLARGDADRWREAAEELVGAEFCDLVEGGELAARIERWEARSAWAS